MNINSKMPKNKTVSKIYIFVTSRAAQVTEAHLYVTYCLNIPIYTYVYFRVIYIRIF